MAGDGYFQKLQDCNLCLDLLDRKRRHPSVVQDWDSALLTPFMAPYVKSIATVVSLKPEAIRQLRPGGFCITRLVLHHYQIQDSDLSAILAATPKLQYFEYHATTDYSWLRLITSPQRKEPTSEHCIGFGPLYDALHSVSDSLTELHTSQGFDEDSIHFNESYVIGHEPPFHQPKELSKLKQLHTLTIPYMTLLGWNCKDCDWKWNEILPSSLRHVILTDNLMDSCFADCWTDESLMPVILSLVDWMSANQRGDKTAVFSLHLFQLVSDFNEPVRLKLSRMCEERGVRCSIKKVRSDRNRPVMPWTSMPRGRGTLNSGRGRGNLTRGQTRGRGT